jgi:hypothetical protein
MSASTIEDRRGFTTGQYLICLRGIAWRESLRFPRQRERFVSALVRPLVWQFIFAAGFRATTACISAWSDDLSHAGSVRDASPVRANA